MSCHASNTSLGSSSMGSTLYLDALFSRRMHLLFGPLKQSNSLKGADLDAGGSEGFTLISIFDGNQNFTKLLVILMKSNVLYPVLQYIFYFLSKLSSSII